MGFAVLAAGLLAAACSSSGGNPPAASSSPGGAAGLSIMVTNGHLTDSTGRTVYLWEADSGGKSSCEGACATAWPPVSGTVKAGTGVSGSKLTMITRSDGATQAVFNQHPLYYYAFDVKAGQTNGQGSNGFGAKWWEMNASGDAITGSGSSMSTAPGGGYGGY